MFARFGYAFVQPDQSPYPAILDMHTIDGDVLVDGAGGPIRLTPFKVDHGTMDALGFRIGALAYLPDVLTIPDASWLALEGLDCWIVDALRRTAASDPRPSGSRARLDRPRRAAPRGADQHAHRPGLCHPARRVAAQRHPRA